MISASLIKQILQLFSIRFFSFFDTADVKLIENAFTYTGSCSLGKYILKQNKNNELLSLSLPSANIE
jgi:hypothetical protein